MRPALIAIALLISGCSVFSGLGERISTDLVTLVEKSAPSGFAVAARGKTVGMVVKSPGAFIAGELGSLQFNIRKGREIVERYNLTDPAPRVAIRLGEVLSEKYGIVVAGDVEFLRYGEASEASTDYTLVVWTDSWGFRPVPPGFDSYPFYSGKLWLTENATGKRLAVGRCEFDRYQVNELRARPEWLANEAVRVKEVHQSAIDHCVSQAIAWTFKDN